MLHFNFIATNHFDLTNFKDLDSFVENYPDFQTVPLRNEKEISVLTKLMGIKNLNWVELNGPNFIKYCDISDYYLPELNEAAFDSFLNSWTELSEHENNMNEYGSLLFLQGISAKWNRLKHRLIVLESENGA